MVMRESISKPDSAVFTALRSGSQHRGATMTALLMRKRTPVQCNPDRDSEARGGTPWAADPRQANSILTESPAQQTSAAVTVFYDGACPLCATEIGFYQRRRGAERVAWVDASACSDSILFGIIIAYTVNCDFSNLNRVALPWEQDVPEPQSGGEAGASGERLHPNS